MIRSLRKPLRKNWIVEPEAWNTILTRLSKDIQDTNDEIYELFESIEDFEVFFEIEDNFAPIINTITNPKVKR
jgi:hypothetical protein